MFDQQVKRGMTRMRQLLLFASLQLWLSLLSLTNLLKLNFWSNQLFFLWISNTSVHYPWTWKKTFFFSKLLVSTQGLDLVHNILVLIGIVKMNLKILCVENLKYKILLVKALKEVSQASGEILILYLTAGAERWGRNWLQDFIQ